MKELMMKFPLLVFFSIVFAASSCTSGNGNSQEEIEDAIQISGTVGFPQTGLILLEEYQDYRPTVIDTIDLNEDYTFSKRLHVEHPGYYRLNFYNLQFINLILHKDNIKVNVDGNNRQGFAEITGSRDHDFIYMIQTMYSDFQRSKEVSEINSRFASANKQGDEEEIKKARLEYMDAETRFNTLVAEKIDSAGATLGVIEILKSKRFLDKDKFHSTYLNIAEEAKVELSNSVGAMEFVKETELSKALAIGQVAPDIVLPNPDGQVISLSSLRGKYVLLDFWAKWCGPCRQENPNIVQAYNKYKDQGFEVFGVSLDRKREDWLQAIEQDGLNWTQVSDLKYWQSEAAILYNVKSIPFALLLDPDGVIVGKNLRGVVLDRKLDEIFNKGK